MVVAGLIFITISLVFFLLATVLFIIYRAFERNGDSVGRVTGTQIDVKHKKDVWLWGGRRRDVFLKHQSTAKYEYRVNGKTYAVKHAEFVTAKQMPRMVSVMYLKRFPKIAYVKDECMSPHYDANALLFVCLGVPLLVLGTVILLYTGLHLC